MRNFGFINLFFGILVLFGSGCSTLPRPVTEKLSGPRSSKFYITAHGKHTGVVISAEMLNRKLPDLKKIFTSEPEYYEIGWGDRDYYQADKASFYLGFAALFLPTDCVVHVAAVPGSPLKYFRNSDVYTLHTDAFNMVRLEKFICSSFEKDKKGHLMPLKEGLYGDSRFYAARGTYFMFNTCNTWTAKALLSAGFDISPSLTFTTDGITDFLNSSDNAALTHRKEKDGG